MPTVQNLILSELAKERTKQFASYVYQRAVDAMNRYAWETTVALESGDLDLALDLTEKFKAARKVMQVTSLHREFDNFADFSVMTLEDISSAIDVLLPILRMAYENTAKTTKEE